MASKNTRLKEEILFINFLKRGHVITTVYKISQNLYVHLYPLHLFKALTSLRKSILVSILVRFARLVRLFNALFYICNLDCSSKHFFKNRYNIRSSKKSSNIFLINGSSNLYIAVCNAISL